MPVVPAPHHGPDGDRAGSVPVVRGVAPGNGAAAVTAEDIARAYWEHSRRRDPMLPRWKGLAPDLRKNRAKDYQSMLDDGWTFTPPGE